MTQRARRRLTRLAIGGLLLVALVAVGSRVVAMEDTFRTLLSLEESYLFPLFAMALLYYVLKALRWHYYLRVAGIHVPLKRSMAAYLAGQWFTFTPAGELMRAYLLGAGSNFAIVAPTVVMQAAVDFASLAMIATLAVPFHPALAPIVLPVTVPLLLTMAVLSTVLADGGARGPHPAGSPPGPLRRLTSGWGFARRLASGRGERVMGQVARLLAPWPIAVGLLMGVPTVAAGALAFFVSGLALDVQNWDAFRATAVYAMTQLVGGVSPLPQGLGVTEGSGTLLLGYLGVEPGMALAAMLLSRGAVLGFSVVLGLIALVTLRLTVPELRHVPVGGVDETEVRTDDRGLTTED